MTFSGHKLFNFSRCFGKKFVFRFFNALAEPQNCNNTFYEWIFNVKNMLKAIAK